MENNIDIDLHFDKEPVNKFFSTGKFITGKITFTPRRDLEVHILGFRLILETRGRLEVKEKTLQEERLIINETIYKDERYSFPFKLYNDRYETYKGLNVRFFIKIETFLRLTKASDRSLLNKLNILSLYNPKEKAITVKYLPFKNEDYFYKVHKNIEALDYKSSTINFIAFGLLYLLGLAGLSYFSFQLKGLIIFTIITVLLINLMQYLLSSKIITGNILATLSNEKNNHFQLKLTNGFNWKAINKLSIHFEIKEKVIDRRGTSDSPQTKSILTSKKQFFKTPTRVIETTFLLPKHQPATTQVKDARIYWQLVVIVYTTFGFKFNYKTEFTVTKEKLTP